MRDVILAAWLMGAIMGCGDDGAGPVDAAVAIDAAGACDPVAAPGQQGCAAGAKCTWIAVQDGPSASGRLGCVPDGSVAKGGACIHGLAGATTGFDNCTAGNVCVGATCRDVCGFDGSLGAACETGFACARHADLFANGDDAPVAGACKATCEPLTQMVAGGGACPGGEGCYPVTSATSTIAVCARAGIATHGQPLTGQVFANSCAPRHAPRHPSTGAADWECGGLCQPADVTTTLNVASEGGSAAHSCESRGASPPDSATAGESCRYFWAREPATTLTPFSNTLGFCWKHAAFQYDTNTKTLPERTHIQP